MSAEETRLIGLDKFYTIPSIAEKSIQTVGSLYDWSEWDLVVEPSAGNGSFFTRIPVKKRIGIDISPEHDEIIKMDFLTYTPDNVSKISFRTANCFKETNILVIGNPPFGKVSSLAIKFFNHAAEWATVIAFIVPRTFRRISIQNKLDKKFHLVYDEDVPMTPCSFDPPMMAKCCFQIWEKKTEERPLVTLETKHKDWDFLGFGPKDDKGQPSPPEGADFAIRAYGGKCGEIVDTDLDKLRPKSWHWIKCNIDKNVLMERFRSLDYKLSLDTARQNSIGRGELVKLYSDAKK